jgi:predicted nucleic acid-binding protein
MLRPTDKFVEVASSAEADVIVTGDMDLQVLNPFRGIRIFTPVKYIRP